MTRVSAAKATIKEEIYLTTSSLMLMLSASSLLRSCPNLPPSSASSLANMPPSCHCGRATRFASGTKFVPELHHLTILQSYHRRSPRPLDKPGEILVREVAS